MIEIHTYNEEWPLLFKTLEVKLRKQLGQHALRIDHIGSTAVPGLAAKPIIDIQISVQKLEPNAPFRLPLEAMGFVFRANNPELTKRYFRETPGTRRTHIHVRKAGSFHEQLALLFRDYLRTHPADAALYAKEKKRIAEMVQENRAAYSIEKGPIIWTIIQKADHWAKEVGWELM